VQSSAAAIPISGIPAGSGTLSLLASVWVPGNTTGAQPPGGGYPPAGGGFITLPPSLIVPIIGTVLLHP
jgi:hypothetical protein